MFGECHAHIFMNGYNYKEAVDAHRPHPDESLIRSAFLKYKEKEVAFIRDGGDHLSVSETAKKISAEYGIDYRTPVFAIHKNGYYGKIVGKGFGTEKEYVSLVKEADMCGCDFIKIMISGILDFAKEGKLTCDGLPENDIRMMIRIAHEEGFAVMAHANGKETAEIAADAGVDSIEHGNFIDRETLKVMKSAGTVFVPTVSAIGNLLRSDRFPESSIQMLLNKAKENIKAAFELGVCTAIGSDAGAYMVPHGGGIYDEYNYFKSCFCADTDMDTWLLKGEEVIKEKFRRH